ncbi:uncharacterized protein D12 [Epargyreus clarus]|uniref:uncharacterized protein D12 n=1 Tax=Epargyreus clarus TaxID=520877 RepID=UPI003C2CC21A
MDSKEEYQDPDYHEPASKKPAPDLTVEENLEKIKRIIRREFANELEVREKEVTLIDQRLTTARRILHKLRYALVNNFFKQEQLQLSSAHLQDDLEALSQVQAKPELSTLLREGQRRIHPSLRKLLGKETVDLEEIFKTRETRKKRQDYHAMVKSKNITTPVGNVGSLRPVKPKESIDVQIHPPVPKDPGTSKPKKVPRHLDPKIVDVYTIDEATRNKMKQRYRIIIGNTSKYAPGASRADRSTHKWLLYIRGPASNPDPSRVLRAATVRLHHSYAPHHTVHLHKPPFHVSRRGWGEFPAKIELHFALPSRNRPATVEHTIKLDRNYTGLQTLGAETIVDVWLYSTPEMLEFEYKEPAANDVTHDTTHTQTDTQTNTNTNLIKPMDIKQEIEDSTDNENTDNWMEFFSKNTTEVNVDEMLVKTNKNNFENMTNVSDVQIKTEIESQDDVQDTNCVDLKVPLDIPQEKRIVKYLEPATGKIYYLEMDRNVDLSAVKEVTVEYDGKKTAKISPVKSNGLRYVRKSKEKERKIQNRQSVLSHIENDHCYYCPEERVNEAYEEDSSQNGEDLDIVKTIQEAVTKLPNVRTVIDYMLKKIPIISEEASKKNYLKYFPFVVDNEERYWKLDFAKRRNIEWSRAKLINKILHDKFGSTEKIWRTKQILIYSRLHGYYPIRTKAIPTQPVKEEWSSWNDPESSRKETNIKEIFPKPADVSTLTVFDSKDFLPYTNAECVDLTDCEEDIDVVDTRSVVKKVLPEVKDLGTLAVLPVECHEDRLRFLYVEKKCADIGIELRNEDVGNGCSYSAVHAVLLSAMKCFAEELIRSALAKKLSEQRDLEYLPSVWVGSSSKTVISLEHVYLGMNNPRLHALTARGLAAERQDTTAPL